MGLFACQKTIDIYDYTDEKFNEEFLKFIFLGIVAYSLKVKQNDNLKWEDENSAAKLGTYKYPLYKFCYDFIKYQYINKHDVKAAEQIFNLQNYLNLKKSQLNENLKIIYSYEVESELRIVDAVKKLPGILSNTSVISLREYGRLANYLIAIKGIIGCNEEVEQCKKIILKNLEKLR